MCMIVWDWNPERRELLLLSNRDEFYERPTQSLHLWKNAGMYAGKDLRAGGSWLGYCANGRLCAVTNFRNGATGSSNAKSRGALVCDFLSKDTDSETYAMQLAQQAGSYNGFNILLFDTETLLGFESHTGRVITLSPGVSGVSNAGFDTPWPKLVKSKQRLEQLRRAGPSNLDDYFSILADRSLASISDLPDTGISTAMELQLSSVFIQLKDYGTRASSFVHVTPEGTTFIEKTFDANGLQSVEHLQLPPPV